MPVADNSKPKKKTKHQEKLEMEQIKENMKAKRIKGYVPRDVFAEDAEKQKRYEEAKLKKEEAEKQANEEQSDAKNAGRGKKRIVGKQIYLSSFSVLNLGIKFCDAKCIFNVNTLDSDEDSVPDKPCKYF